MKGDKHEASRMMGEIEETKEALELFRLNIIKDVIEETKKQMGWSS